MNYLAKIKELSQTIIDLTEEIKSAVFSKEYWYDEYKKEEAKRIALEMPKLDDVIDPRD